MPNARSTIRLNAVGKAVRPKAALMSFDTRPLLSLKSVLGQSASAVGA